MNNQVKTIGILLMLLVSAFAVTVTRAEAATGNPIGFQIVEVKVNDDVLTDNETVRTQLQRDNTLDVTVRFQTDIPSNSTNSTGTAHDVEVTASLFGYEYNNDPSEQISATSEPFDVESGVVYTKHLTLKLPDTLQKDDYKLRIMVADRYSMLEVFNYNLQISADKHDLVIKDVTLTPDDLVKTGRALLAVARVQNQGQNDEQDVKVTVAIPDLGISSTDYLDTLKADESKSSEQLYLRIPVTATSGTYDLVTTVTFDNGHGKVTKTVPVKVVADQTLSQSNGGEDQQGTAGTGNGKTVVTVGPQSQTVTRAEGGAIYKLTLANQGSTTKQYVVEVPGADWADVRINPSSVVVLEAGQTKDVFVYVAAKETASVGPHPFNIDLKSGENVLQSISLNADVIDSGASSGSSLKKGLEVGLVVLIVLLVIVAIVLAVTKAGKKDDEHASEASEPIAQTYY